METPLCNVEVCPIYGTVTITGKILDMNYANILAENPDLNLLDIELLNRMQLDRPLSDKEIARLRNKRLIEGRKPKHRSLMTE